TTVAPQALFMLNDPFVRGNARALAAGLLRRKDVGDDGRIDAAYRATLGRPATKKEIERVKDYLADYESAARDQPQEKADRTDPTLAAWGSFCQALFGSAEFRYVR